MLLKYGFISAIVILSVLAAYAYSQTNDQHLTLQTASSPDISLFAFTPVVEPTRLPRPDPALVAFEIVRGKGSWDYEPSRKGGLWITGDRDDGLGRLRWIVGTENAESLSLDGSGKVRLDTDELERAAGLDQVIPSRAPAVLTDYISSNEGLLLIVQLTQGTFKYRLHIDRQAPTLGGIVRITACINLDNNFDSRINPRRRLRTKLDNERPPEGFDSLIAIHPAARWFNLRAKAFVAAGDITFHELVEAHAKLELGLDYLEQGSRPGAHDVALMREGILKAQRPLSNPVITLGLNRVLRSEQEVREFFVENKIKSVSQVWSSSFILPATRY